MFSMDQGTQHLIDETVNLLHAFWSDHEVPMLLSTLGNTDRGRISREAKRHSDGLREFLEQVVGDRVIVVQHSKKPTIVGAVERNEETIAIDDWDEILEKTSNKNTQRRLHPALWAAFRKPIREGMERYFEHGEPVRFSDVEGGDEIQNALRVDRKFIAGPDASPDKVYENATAWLRENQLEISDFEADRGARTPVKLPHDDLLGKLILALEPRDLEKISIPMEVVAKLRRQAG